MIPILDDRASLDTLFEIRSDGTVCEVDEDVELGTIIRSSVIS